MISHTLVSERVKNFKENSLQRRIFKGVTLQ
jgi:hypothetical protein